MKNGFYVFKPKRMVYTNQYDMYLSNWGKLVVEVVEDSVYLTNVNHTYDIYDVKKLGKFKKRVKL